MGNHSHRLPTVSPFWRTAITAAREARRLIPSEVVTRLTFKAGTALKEGRAEHELTLFNLEGTQVTSVCTLKTEQREKRRSKATEGKAAKAAGQILWNYRVTTTIRAIKKILL